MDFQYRNFLYFRSFVCVMKSPNFELAHKLLDVILSIDRNLSILVKYGLNVTKTYPITEELNGLFSMTQNLNKFHVFLCVYSLPFHFHFR